MRSRGKAAASWLTHAVLGDDFVRVGLCDAAGATLDAVSSQVSHLTRADARDLVGALPGAPS